MTFKPQIQDGQSSSAIMWVFVETQTQKWLLIWDAGSDDVG